MSDSQSGPGPEASTPEPDAPAPGPVTVPPRPPTRQRGNPSVGDMVRSIVLIGIVVLGAVGLTNFLRGPTADPVRDIDVAQVATQATISLDYDPLAPVDLPDGWVVSSARLAGDDLTRWEVGAVTGDDEFVGLEQDVLGVDEAVDELVGEADETGDVEAAGLTWTAYADGDETVWVAPLPAEGDGPATTLVLTTTSDTDDLETFAASLEPVVR